MPDKEMDREARVEEMWREYMSTGEAPDYAGTKWFDSKIFRPLVKRLPHDPRCRICYYPFEGVGGALARALLGREPAKMNPQMCNSCEAAANRFPGGAEVELTMLFADIRGSTALAEEMTAADFSALIDRFYGAATKELFNRNALVEKLIGDEVSASFVPGFAGPEHAIAAVEAGRAILRATGHEDGAAPWAPVGVGVHTGTAYVGSVTAEGGTAEITALGDTPNSAAHITSRAGAGEMLISETARSAAGLKRKEYSYRRLNLKGKDDPVDVWVARISSGRRDGGGAAHLQGRGE